MVHQVKKLVVHGDVNTLEGSTLHLAVSIALASEEVYKDRVVSIMKHGEKLYPRQVEEIRGLLTRGGALKEDTHFSFLDVE